MTSLRRLRLVSTIAVEGALPLRWTLDAPARGVVILDVEVGDATSDVPLHWRAGDWTKPPLDLRLNTAGFVQGIQLVFQDEVVEAGEAILPPSELSMGLPAFDVSDWPDDRYVDVLLPLRTFKFRSGELYTAIGGDPPSKSLSVVSSLRFDFDSTNQLVGIALGPLSPVDWEQVAMAARR
jgi:hypothetical protein